MIFGDVIAYHTIWRTGANAATGLRLDHDVMVGTTKVPAGEYTLFSLPTADAWTLVVSKKNPQVGDRVRLDRRPCPDTRSMVTAASSALEQFTISVDPHGVMSFAWDTRVGQVTLRPTGT